MSKQAIKMSGIIQKVHSMNEYEVKLKNNLIIKATISGKMRVFKIRILPGDRVDLEISPYDLTRGRIVYRYNN